MKRHGGQLFKAFEKSGACSRIMCAGNMRPLKIIIEHISPESNKDRTNIFRCDKGCGCSFLCFCRPEMVVKSVEDGQLKGQEIGKIVQPFQCCNIVLELKDPYDKTILTIDGPCCQCGIWFPTMPCDQC